MKGLLIFDLDGTALGGYEPYKRLPAPLCAFLDRLAEKDWQWAINTAWALDDQWKLVLESGVQSRPLCLISEYGRRMAVPDQADGIRRLDDYEARHAARLEKACEEHVRPLLAQALLALPVREMVYYGHLSQVKLYEDSANEERMKRFLEPWQSDPALELSVSANGFSVRPSTIHKGLGVEGVIDFFGVSRENIVTAGDGYPDIAMMRISGWAVCPQNAEVRVVNYLAHRPHAVIGNKLYCDGVIEAFLKLSDENHWLI